MKRYNPKELEPKWQKIWSEQKLYDINTDQSDNKFYIIPMFPYPSGDLHVGHWYNFAPTDVIARWHRMRGYKVLHVNGFDAFGLPAENAAIQRNIAPAKWTSSNIESMTKQIKAIGASYDWNRELITSQPDYYRWTQWLFIKLFEEGLAYKKNGLVNWCPKDQTVLANEQVVGEDNHCERCGTPVIQKELEQWYFKITDYSDRLLDDAEQLDWPERVKIMQANWIGRSRGAMVDFKVSDHDETITVFTTRPDTLFGATYMVLAPEHPLIAKLTSKDQKEAVDKYVDLSMHKTELERKEDEKKKTGVFSGAYAINPLTNKKIPIWIADYVLMDYGTGSIMAVPAHDERDYEFAKKYQLDIVPVIKPEDKKAVIDQAYSDEGVTINSGDYNGLNSAEAREKIVKALVAKSIAKEQVNYRLRDWLISRQRYWGTPIPIVYCDKCGTVSVPEDQLPVLLPEDVSFNPTGQSPLLSIDSFVNTTCPKCRGPARRETDTMDTFVDSSWYFLRYPNVSYEKGPFDPEVLAKWGPVDHYIGGIEHAILHLLYARFITKFLHDKFSLSFDEPFRKLSNQGIILGPDGFKMSKSKGNVISPDEQVISYGADSLRMYLMFMGPYDQGGPYSMGGITGVRRFLDRYWTLVQEFLQNSGQIGEQSIENDISRVVHRTIKRVSKDLEQLSFNVAISALMECVNELYRLKEQDHFANHDAWQFALESLTKLLAPFAPHITEEVWQQLGHNESVHLSDWPVHDESYISEDSMTIVVQVNGKLRSQIELPSDSTEDRVLTFALGDQKVKTAIGDDEVIKKIYVPGKLVNLVVK